MLINIEVEAIKSEVHLNYPVDRREEKGWDQAKKSSFKVQKKAREELRKRLTDINKIVIVKDVNSKSR